MSTAKQDQMILIRRHPQGIVFKVFVQPRSSANKIVGVRGDALKLKVTAPPVGGAANQMCLKFLAKQLAAPASRLEIISGHNARTKKILWHSTQADAPENEPEYEMERFRQKIENLIEG